MFVWKASSNDGAFEDKSLKSFNTKKEAYLDMRNAVLDKMKWNTEYEDFEDKNDVIDYDVNFQFTIGKIIHESYSGVYIYQIYEE